MPGNELGNGGKTLGSAVGKPEGISGGNVLGRTKGGTVGIDGVPPSAGVAVPASVGGRGKVPGPGCEGVVTGGAGPGPGGA